MNRRSFLQRAAAAPIAALAVWHRSRVVVDVRPRCGWSRIDIWQLGPVGDRLWTRTHVRALPPWIRTIVGADGSWVAVQGSADDGRRWANLIEVPTFGPVDAVLLFVDGRGV